MSAFHLHYHTRTLKGDYKEYLTDALSGKVEHSLLARENYFHTIPQPARRIFCPNCGSPIATYPDSNKDIAFVKAGTLSDMLLLC